MKHFSQTIDNEYLLSKLPWYYAQLEQTQQQNHCKAKRARYFLYYNWHLCKIYVVRMKKFKRIQKTFFFSNPV